MLQPAVFLDRDGVIIENRTGYVRSWADVSFIPGALDGLRRLKNSSYRIIIVTNQSAVGRGILTLDEAMSINERIVTYVEREGGRIDAVYMCPHAPRDHCKCRKPKPGLILKATKDLDIKLSESVIIGDAFSDLEAGQAARVASRALVLTGRGTDQLASLNSQHLESFSIYHSLLEAGDAIVGN